MKNDNPVQLLSPELETQLKLRAGNVAETTEDGYNEAIRFV